MKDVINLLFEARILKEIPRTGYHFLGSGRESVAEHAFSTIFIGYVLSKMVPEADALKLLQLCLVHDLPEARTGDLNYVHKKYLNIDGAKVFKDIASGLPFGDHIIALLEEFDQSETLESRLANDADQLSFILELKVLSDRGDRPPEKWLRYVLSRLKTEAGKEIAREILKTESDEWWFDRI
nr:HD domain-containing protein [Desulfobacterales bacterium]